MGKRSPNRRTEGCKDFIQQQRRGNGSPRISSPAFYKLRFFLILLSLDNSLCPWGPAPVECKLDALVLASFKLGLLEPDITQKVIRKGNHHRLFCLIKFCNPLPGYPPLCLQSKKPSGVLSLSVSEHLPSFPVS